MPQAKCKLAELVGQAPVSYSGLSRIIDALRDHMPDASSRAAITRAIKSDLALQTPCGPLLQTIKLELKNGKHFAWQACHPGATLSWLCSYSPHFDECLRAGLRSPPSSPESPWTICMYADEAAAGNMLRIDHTRKAWLIYWGLVEMGKQHLSHENNWMVAGVIRTKTCEKFKGGISGVLRAVLGEFSLAIAGTSKRRAFSSNATMSR